MNFAREDHEGFYPVADHRGERSVDVFRALKIGHLKRHANVL
jgi:hypothetical protein